MWRGLALVGLAACWTGPEQQPAAETLDHPVRPPPVPHRAFDLVMERTPCFGMCPTYTVRITATGAVEWVGRENVAAVGRRTERRLSSSQLARIDRALDEAHFFELDESGHAQTAPACVRTGNSVSCSLSSFTVCSDTSHTIITVRRGSQENRVDNAHCSDAQPALDTLEQIIDAAAVPPEWVGR